MSKDDKLKAALKKAYDEKYVYDPQKENKLTWKFTKEYDFELKINKLISSRTKHSNQKNSNIISRRIIVAIMILCIVFSSVMIVYAFKRPILEFIVKRYNEFSSFFVDNTTLSNSQESVPQRIEKIYIPAEIPNDYELINSYSDDFNVVKMWKNNKGNNIEFYQKVLTTNNSLNTEGATAKSIIIENRQVYTYTQKELTSYIWLDKGYIFIINVPVELSVNEVSKIINSIKIVE